MENLIISLKNLKKKKKPGQNGVWIFFLGFLTLPFNFFVTQMTESLAENSYTLLAESKFKREDGLKNKKNPKADFLKVDLKKNSKEKSVTKSPLPNKSQLNFADADPEDITNENFPDLIQSFDYPDTPIAEIIKAISKLTNKNFIVDSTISRQKISIIAPSPITVAEAYKVFLTALSMNNLTVVPTKDGKFLKIRKTSDATRDSVETYSGEYFPHTDQLITYVFALKYISTNEILSNIKNFLGSQAKIVAHNSTNTLIITDYGSNIDRVKMILKNLDLPGSEEKMEVIPVFHANAEEVASLLNRVFLKGSSSSSTRSRYSSRKSGTSSRGADTNDFRKSLSLVLAYTRSNSIIVLGTPAGIKNIKGLIRQLDVEMDESGGIFVYSVRYGEAKKIATVLNNVIAARSENDGKKGSNKGGSFQGLPRNRFAFNRNQVSAGETPFFSKKLKIIPDEENNNLIIVGDRSDHNGIKTLISKIDVPRNQVYLRVVVLDMDISKNMEWGVNYHGAPFEVDSKGQTIRKAVTIPGIPDPVYPALGFRSKSMSEILSSVSGGGGLILGLKHKDIDINYDGKKYRITDIFSLINFLKINTNTTILSRPQVMVMDNQKAVIEFGEEVKVGETTQSTGNQGIHVAKSDYKEAKRKLEFTPFISEETNTIRLTIEQTDDHPVKDPESENYRFKRRSLNSTLVIQSGDTAILGGLMSETEEETVTKVPLLGDLPIIGWLFKGSGKKQTKSNIFAFITPTIVRSFDVSQNLRKSRMKLLEKDYKMLNQDKGRTVKKLNKLFKELEFKENVSSLRKMDETNKVDEKTDVIYEEEEEEDGLEDQKEET